MFTVMPCGRELDRQGLGEADDAALRRDVVRHVGRAGLRARRRDGHDAAPPRSQHVGDRRLQAVERAREVDREDPRPRLGGDVGERGRTRRARARDHDLDGPELGADLAQRFVDRRTVGDVDLAGRARARRPPVGPRRRARAASPSRSSSPTRWPRSARCRLTASPIPDAAPVTTATRPMSSPFGTCASREY